MKYLVGLKYQGKIAVVPASKKQTVELLKRWNKIRGKKARVITNF